MCQVHQINFLHHFFLWFNVRSLTQLIQSGSYLSCLVSYCCNTFGSTFPSSIGQCFDSRLGTCLSKTFLSHGLENNLAIFYHVPLHCLIFYDNEHMKNVLMHHLEGIQDLPLSRALSQLIYLCLYYQDDGSSTLGADELVGFSGPLTSLSLMLISIFSSSLEIPIVSSSFSIRTITSSLFGFVKSQGLIIRNLSKAPLCVSTKSSISFFLFLFSLPDWYFLNDIISTQRKNKN
jgi:hypothetical protein